MTWIALTVLVHGLRSMRPVPGIPYLWLALFVSLAIARRDTLPISGSIYFVILAAEAAIVTLAFALDRLAAPRLSGVGSTLVLPLESLGLPGGRAGVPRARQTSRGRPTRLSRDGDGHDPSRGRAAV
jgi:hypothetical protein